MGNYKMTEFMIFNFDTNEFAMYPGKPNAADINTQSYYDRV